MPKDDNWLSCESCDSEYKIVSSISNELVASFCPFCGNENEELYDIYDFDED